MFITLINSNYVNKQSSKFIIIYVILIASIFKLIYVLINELLLTLKEFFIYKNP